MSASATAYKPSRKKRNKTSRSRNEPCLFVKLWKTESYRLNEPCLKELVCQYITHIDDIFLYKEGNECYGKIAFESHSVAKIVVQELQGHKLFQVRYWRASDSPTSYFSPAVSYQGSSKNETIARFKRPSGPQLAVSNEYPRNWKPMADTEQSKLVVLSATSREFSIVSDKFMKTMAGHKVLQIRRVQNKWIWRNYSHTKHMMHEKNDGRVNEKDLFHGSRQTVAESVNQKMDLICVIHIRECGGLPIILLRMHSTQTHMPPMIMCMAIKKCCLLRC